MSVNYGATESKTQRTEQRTTVDNDPTSSDASKPVTGTDVGFKRGQDGVIINDSSNPIPTKSDEVSEFDTNTLNVGDTPTEIKLPTSLTGRKVMVIQPKDGIIAVGASDVTFATGLIVEVGGNAKIKVSDSTVKWYAIADTGATVVSIVQEEVIP